MVPPITKQQPVKKIVLEEQAVYRCGYCGKVVGAEGSELDKHDLEYNIALLRKFGERLSKPTTGYCCKDRNVVIL